MSSRDGTYRQTISTTRRAPAETDVQIRLTTEHIRRVRIGHPHGTVRRLAKSHS